MNKLYTKLLTLLLVVSCGDSIDADRRGVTLPLPSDEIQMLAEIDQPSQESNPSELTLSFSARIEMPQTLSVLRGNSGVGFASLSVNNQKFCYQGNALSESNIDGDEYFLRYETQTFLQCTLGGVVSLNPVVTVQRGDRVQFQIEEAGCSIESASCLFTRAQAIIDILETFP